MVAVNHVTMLALSLASLSFADAAAVNARPSAPDSPSKPSRQHASPLPMPMKRMVDNDSPSRRQRPSDAMSKRSQKSRTTEVNTPLRKAFMRRQKQASFRAPRSDDSPAESDAVPGRVDIFRDNHKVGQLALNDTQKPYTLYASQNETTPLDMVSSGNGSCTIQRSIDSTPHCATFDPCPPAPESLKMTPCTTDLDPHSSQTFSYNSSSGEIRPMWRSNCTRSADIAPLNSSTPTVGSRAETAKSVTLVFVPSAPAANEADVSQSASASASTSYVATETITTTVTASVGASSSTPASPASTSSPSVLAAQVDPVSSTDSVSQTASSSSATDSSVASASSSVASASSSVASASSSVASASSSAVPTPGALAVEVASASASAIPSASSSAVSSSLSDSSASPAPSSVSSVAASATPSAFAAAADPSVSDSASATSSALGSASVSDVAPTSSSPLSSDAASASSSPSSSAADVEPTAAVYVGKARGAETPQW
ncbi:hypothetical protein DFH08DRAFT_955207 [Mycena albidolilacea]|uniref:Uncharacterized protein n=1 Tax=Mycena albidolilacea TaxID=1033008 RepID=A0AAD7ADG2_9AGAR|nr:hypothetical protein DFH08DRAFT_955207 [Mycena albidolilacea]